MAKNKKDFNTEVEKEPKRMIKKSGKESKKTSKSQKSNNNFLTEEQKIKNERETYRIMSVIIAVICAYIFGYIGSLSVSESIGIFDAASEMISEFGIHTLLFELNAGACVGVIFAIILGCIINFYLNVDADKNRIYDKNKSAGDGGLMSEEEIKNFQDEFVDPDPDKNIIMNEKVRRPIDGRIIGNNNVLVVGGAGGGKSAGYVKPNIMQMNASYVITDPSGEMIYSMGNMLQKHGYKIKIFNISDLKHSNCYNPLHYIRDAAGVKMVVECLINNTTGKGKAGDQFFIDAEKLLYSACIFYLLETCNDESVKNFPQIMKMINMASAEETAPGKPAAQSHLDALFTALPADSLAKSFYISFKKGSAKTTQSIIISCAARLQSFMVPQVINLTKTDNLELEKIGDERTALFIITPQADRTYSFLASMLYSQMFETLYFIGEQRKQKTGSEKMPIPVMALMDEYANIGEVPEFPSKLATMRKYNISASVIVQDLSQLKAMHDDLWASVTGNCSTHIFLGSTEPDTLKYFSEKLGKMTIRTKSVGRNKGKSKGSSENYSYTSREVMTEDELQRLPSDECIVYTQNYRAVRAKKAFFWNHPRYNETGDYKETDSNGNIIKKGEGFIYKNISEYDNTKIRTNSLLRAKAAAAKVRKREMISDPISAKRLKVKSTQDTANLIHASDDEENKMIIHKSNEAMDRIMEYMNSPESKKMPFPVIKLENVQPDQLKKIYKRLKHAMNINTCIIFDELATDKDFIRGFTWGDQALLQAVQKNEYIKDMNKNNDFITFKIAKRNETKFMECVEKQYREKQAND